MLNRIPDWNIFAWLKRGQGKASSAASGRQTVSGLRKSLIILFTAMALPIAALVWHAYGQLKWESFHRHRTFAEEVANRIDDQLSRIVTMEQQRPVLDYTFASPGSPSSSAVRNIGYLQRSPLSYLSPANVAPGTLGYFQIDAEGVFSTPAVAGPDLDSASLQITDQEIATREALSQQLQQILSDNQLLESAADSNLSSAALQDDAAAESSLIAQTDTAKLAKKESNESSAVSAASAPPSETGSSVNPKSQLGFDLLNSTTKTERSRQSSGAESAFLNPGKPVAKLELDSRYDLKSEQYDREQQSVQQEGDSLESSEDENAGTISLKESLLRTIDQGVGPIEFSVLDSGHFLLFRRVWNQQQRLIQGLLLDQESFLKTEIGEVYEISRLFASGSLVVAYDGNVLRSFSDSADQSYASAESQQGVEDTLLYNRALSSPLGSLQLVFTVRSLPPGPGAGVLAWVSLLVATVLSGGFYFLYRLGIKQIALASLQRNFISSVSHELKTPLTSIRMYSEMLKSGWASDEKKQRYYDYIHDESERLSRLISNVLKLSNLHDNELELDLRAVSLRLLIQQLERNIAVQLQQSDFSLTFNVSSPLAATADQYSVQIDEDSVTQIMINLVDNAVKFSKNAANLTIHVNCQLVDTDRVLFSVRDFGPGIPKDQLRNIFKLFYRPENELTRETVGTGIGLSIVNQLVNLMHGSIDVVNMDPGAEFRFYLPLLSPSNEGTEKSSDSAINN